MTRSKATARCECPERPGLGIELDRSALDKYRVG